MLQARLDAAQTRNLTLQSAHAAQRAALRREILRISRDLSGTQESLSVLETALVNAQTAGFETQPDIFPEGVRDEYAPLGATPQPAHADSDVAG